MNESSDRDESYSNSDPGEDVNPTNIKKSGKALRNDSNQAEGQGGRNYREQFLTVLRETVPIYTNPPNFVITLIKQNDVATYDFIQTLCKKLGKTTIIDVQELFKNEIESVQVGNAEQLLSRPCFLTLSSMLKNIFNEETIKSLLTDYPWDIELKESDLQHSLAIIVDLLRLLVSNKNPWSDSAILRVFQRLCKDLCRVQINYKEISSHKKYKCMTSGRKVIKSLVKKTRTEYVWVALTNDNRIELLDKSQTVLQDFEVDLFSFSGKTMYIHDTPVSTKCEIEIDMYKTLNIDEIWSLKCLRTKKIPFYWSFDPFYQVFSSEPDPKNPQEWNLLIDYCNACKASIVEPLSIVMSAFFYIDENTYQSYFRPNNCNELFDAFLTLYVKNNSIHEMLTVFVVNELTHAQSVLSQLVPNYTNGKYLFNNTDPYDPDRKKKKSFLSYFVRYFFDKFSQNYTNEIINDKIFKVINSKYPKDVKIPTARDWDSQAEKQKSRKSGRNIRQKEDEIENQANETSALDEFFDTIIDILSNNISEISPEIFHLGSILQNFIIMTNGTKEEIYYLMRDFFFIHYLFPKLREREQELATRQQLRDTNSPENQQGVTSITNSQARKSTSPKFAKNQLVGASAIRRFILNFTKFTDPKSEITSKVAFEAKKKLFKFLMNLSNHQIDYAALYQTVFPTGKEIETIFKKLSNPNATPTSTDSKQQSNQNAQQSDQNTQPNFKIFRDNLKKRLLKIQNNSPLYYGVSHTLRLMCSNNLIVGNLKANDRKAELEVELIPQNPFEFHPVSSEDDDENKPNNNDDNDEEYDVAAKKSKKSKKKKSSKSKASSKSSKKSKKSVQTESEDESRHEIPLGTEINSSSSYEGSSEKPKPKKSSKMKTSSTNSPASKKTKSKKTKTGEEAEIKIEATPHSSSSDEPPRKSKRKKSSKTKASSKSSKKSKKSVQTESEDESRHEIPLGTEISSSSSYEGSSEKPKPKKFSKMKTSSTNSPASKKAKSKKTKTGEEAEIKIEATPHSSSSDEPPRAVSDSNSSSSGPKPIKTSASKKASSVRFGLQDIPPVEDYSNSDVTLSD